MALPLFLAIHDILHFAAKHDTAAQTSPRQSHGGTIFAAVSGQSAATAAKIGKMSMPKTGRRRQSENLIVGRLAGQATLHLLIQPSVILVIYDVAQTLLFTEMFRKYVAGNIDARYPKSGQVPVGHPAHTAIILRGPASAGNVPEKSANAPQNGSNRAETGFL